MNPYHYVVFSEEPGYIAMAKQKDKRIQGIVVVHKDSPIQNLEELRGERLAFPAPPAFAASILPRGPIKGIELGIQPVYVSSHDSVYRNIVQGNFVAGGGVKRTFNAVAPEIRSQLKILWTTQSYTSHAIAHHPSIPKDVVERVNNAMLKISDSEEGQALLKAINFRGIEKAQHEQWDDVRELRINLLK